MTREDITRMAREAGWTECSVRHPVEVERLERFAAAEREACAKVCEQMRVGIDAFGSIDYHVNLTRDMCANAIRARGGEMSDLPYVAIGPDELGEPAEVVDCTRCGQTHAIEYGTSQTLRADNTWSEPVPSKKLGFYKCGGNLYLGTVEGRRWK